MDINNMMKNMEMTSQQKIKAEEGDYIVDGLLYCHKCNTKKQTRIEVAGKVWTPFCLCKCESERLEKEEAERKRIQFLERVKSLRKRGFPEAQMIDWTFAKDDHANEKISSVAQKYVEHFEEMKAKSKGLLLYGTVGTGKTFISACIANALIDQGIPCLMTNFARLCNTISGMYDGKQEYIDGLSKFDLLVIDDLASERDTEFMSEIVHNIIDSRYRSGKPLIVTTNLTAEELKNPAEIRKQRIYSRLFEMCLPIQVAGADRRKQKLIDEYKELEDLLDL